MKVKLPYGRQWIDLDVEEDKVEVIESREIEVTTNIREKLLKRLNSPIEHVPLKRAIKKSDSILIIVPDKTRAFPSKTPSTYIRRNR